MCLWIQRELVAAVALPLRVSHGGGGPRRPGCAGGRGGAGGRGDAVGCGGLGGRGVVGSRGVAGGRGGSVGGPGGGAGGGGGCGTPAGFHVGPVGHNGGDLNYSVSLC